MFCITDEARLLVIPDVFSCDTQNKHSKYEQDGEPHLPNHGGVDMNLLQNASKEIPVPHVYLVSHLISEPHQIGGRYILPFLKRVLFLKQTCGQNMNKASLFSACWLLSFFPRKL